MLMTVASGERSFSKTHLRLTILQERLSKENGIVKIIDLENIFRDFANKKTCYFWYIKHLFFS